MATPIEKKIQQLQANHFVLGRKITDETDAGYGGRWQQFANVNIYYHHAMGAESCVVHGGSLRKYQALGGHDRDPASGQRLLGFPLSDETNSKDERCRVSRFEWGTIYWMFGGVAVFGPVYQMHGWAGSEIG